MKKILCLLLAISLAVSVAVIAPVTASAAETDGSAVGTTPGEDTYSISLGDQFSFIFSANGECNTRLKYVAEKDTTIIFSVSTYTHPEYGFPEYGMYDSEHNKTEYEAEMFGDYDIGEYGYNLICDVTAGEIYYFTAGFRFTGGDFDYTFDSSSDVYVSLNEFLLFPYSDGTITGYNGKDTEVVIPSEIDGEEITAIGYRAFYNSDIKSVTIPDGITTIDDMAFCNCPNLKSITIPDSVNYIGDNAFGYGWDKDWNYSTIDGFTIYGYTGNAAEYYAKENGLNFVSLGETQNPMYPMTGVNWECEWTLTEDGLLTISGSGEWYKAFNIDYERVREIIVEEGVTDIGNGAFNECSNLESVTINAKIPMIDVSTFGDCAKLKKVTLPDSIKSIEYYAFKGCNALDSITIPDSVDYIDIYALGYYWNENQDTVKVDGFTIYGYTGNAAEYYANKNGFNFVSLGETQNPMFPMKGTDGDCEWTLTEDGVLTISGSGELYRCDKLDSYYVREIIVEEGVEGICRGTFSSYENLESVTINAKIPMIGACAFDSCANLKNVTLPDSLKSIERVAFSCCTALESITIPDSVNYIGDCALGYGWDEDWNYSPIDGFTIYGYTGNAAEYYAKENGFNFVSLGESQNPATPDEATPDEATPDEATPDEATPDEATPDEATPDEATPDEPKGVGDANGDGVTDILDGALIQKYLVGKIEYPEEYLSWLDVNNDNAVDILDATDIQKFAAGIITEFNRRE